MCLPRREKGVCISHFATPSFLESWHDVGNTEQKSMMSMTRKKCPGNNSGERVCLAGILDRQMAHTTKWKAMWGERGETFLSINIKKSCRSANTTYSRMPKLATMFVRVPKGQQDCISTEEIYCSRPRHQYQSVPNWSGILQLHHRQLTNLNCGDVKAPERIW